MPLPDAPADPPQQPAAGPLPAQGPQRPLMLALLALAVCLAVTLSAWQNTRSTSHDHANQRFEYRTDRIVREMHDLLGADEMVLRAVAGLFSVSGGVNLSQWRTYFDGIETGARTPGRLWVAFAPRVTEAGREAHERQVRNDGVAGYSVRTSQKRPQYFPLAYLRSFGNADRRAIGIDLQEEPAAREALARAGRDGALVMAGPLEAPGVPGHAVWALFVPVYGRDMDTDTPAGRQQALAGFVVQAFDPAEVAASAIGPDTGLIGMAVTGGDRGTLFRSPELQDAQARGWRPRFARRVELEFGQRRWALQFTALPQFQEMIGADSSWFVLFGGLAISVLMAGLVQVLAGMRARALALVEHRTAALRAALAERADSEARLRAVFDHALDGIITIDAQGTVLSYNPAAERMFGWTEAEVLGRNVSVLMPSPDRERHGQYLANYLGGGAPRIIGAGRLVTGLRKDGTRMPIDLGVSETQVGGQRLFCGILRDETERVASEDALRRSESQLRSYIDLALDGVMVVDAEGRYLEANPAASQMLGYATDELLRIRLEDVVWPSVEDRAAGLAHFRQVIAVGRSVGEVALRRKDGQRIIVDLRAVELGNGRYLGIMRDVTQRHLAEQALQRERELLEERVAERTTELVAAREQALDAAEAKASFLANMSHEIRTPMNAVIGMTALLQDTHLDAEQRNYVETIRTSGDALLAIINDILDFSKVEAGMLELERRPFELGACIEEAFDMLAPRAAEKGIDLLYEMADNVPQWLVGDSMRLRQVLVNLLSNAVKFTDQGEVSMGVSVLRRVAEGVQLRFSVRDTGIGIAPSQREHLFKAFSQADSSTTRRYGGTGLGLAISARLVRLMGGDIRVESEEGRGSTFSFTMQAGMAQNVPTARYRSGHAPELAGRRVLVVDDNPTNLQMVKTQCTRWGMEVAIATRGTHALAMLEAEAPFDVAVLDLHMPGMDGLQLARAIASQRGASAPPLVLLSSSIPRSDPAGRELFAARLAKPVKHSQLFTVLTEVVHGRRAAVPAAASQRIDHTLAQRVPIRILVVEDSAINQKLAVGMLRKFGYSADLANNGAEALERVRDQHYDLVFMDLQMPVMDGLEATRHILELVPPHRRPRIVAMTANALPAHRQRCMDAGMDDYIAKPILPAAVQALIERWGQRLQASPPEVAEAALVDERVLRELAALDSPGQPGMLRGLVGDYLNEAPGAVSAIKQYHQQGAAGELARRAHRLAGTSASLGASGVAEVCGRIEQQALAGQLDPMPALIDELEMRFARTRPALAKFVGAVGAEAS